MLQNAPLNSLLASSTVRVSFFIASFNSLYRTYNPLEEKSLILILLPLQLQLIFSAWNRCSISSESLPGIFISIPESEDVPQRIRPHNAVCLCMGFLTACVAVSILTLTEKLSSIRSHPPSWSICEVPYLRLCG